MSNNETIGEEIKLSLKKSQIIRGFEAYKRVLTNSRVFSTDLLLAYLNTEDLSNPESKTELNKEEVLSPLEHIVKAGFIISKKKIKKATKRNYGKRLMKEAFRLNGDFFLTFSLQAA
jgi:ribonuclease P protein component